MSVELCHLCIEETVFSGWPQGQFIQQIPHTPQTPLEGYPQQYPNAIYQATYQQPGFESNTFYASPVQPVQVLTPAQRPPSQSGHAPGTPRANGSYAHTPSPSPIGQNQQNGHRSNITAQYQQEYPSTGQTFNPSATPTPTSNIETTSNGGISRPSSVGSNVNIQGNQSQNFTPTSNSFTTISSSNFSPGANAPPNYVGSSMQNQASSGNAKPGYPQVSSSPQLASHNSSGYPGGQFSGQNIQPNNQSQMSDNRHPQQQNWTPDTDRSNWDQSIGNNMQHSEYMQHNTQHNIQNMGHSQNQMNIKSINQSMPMEQTQSHLQQSPNSSNQNHPHNAQMHIHMQGQQNNMNQQPTHQISHQINNEVPNGGEPHFSQADRVNLNSRIKTMILNKQQSMESKLDESQKIDENSTTGHFLSYSHHRRLNYYSDGGGPFDFSPPYNGSALENMMKFATNETYTQPKSIDSNNANQVAYRPFSYPDNSSLNRNNITDVKMEGNYQIARQNFPPSSESSPNIINNQPYYPKTEDVQNLKSINVQNNQSNFQNNYPAPPQVTLVSPKIPENTTCVPTDTIFIKKEPYQSYNEENICKTEPPEIPLNSEEKDNYLNTETNILNNSEHQNTNLEIKNIKIEQESYLFKGSGGPAALQTPGGSWCCRRGGTDPPTSEHLKDGICMGLQTKDEVLEEKNPDDKNSNQTDMKKEKCDAAKEYNDNVEKLKNNLKTEIPECGCFPADKNPPEPGSYYTNLGE